ncbi:MAG TPA: adenylate/guanylate cyclase domain-containing protein [Candidatus Limnocylindrales bacterium]
MSALPSGTVTFVFSDIEGSTRLVQELGEDYPPLLAEHRRLIGEAVSANGGRIFGSEGDALFAAFDTAGGAVRAAAAAQRALAGYGWPKGAEIRVRMGVHTGEAMLAGDNYVGLTLHQVARVMSAGHGGQVLVSATTHGLVGDAPADGLTLRDVGEQRLKDLAQPVRLFQLVGDDLASDFPALRTLNARPNNLPVQLTSFVGREELAMALAALAGTRLLTLTGPGGTGKTRLALQLAAETLDQFSDGSWFVALDAVSDHELVVPAISSTVGVKAGGAKPAFEQLVDHLRDKRVLLVLDNFEQVLDAAPQVGQLLRELPELKVIVTSRIVLRVYGEQELVVPPLGLPAGSAAGAPLTAEEAGRSEAVSLFVERARAVQPAFMLTDANAAAVADIVARLDGLPLAIELAAARLRILSVEAIRSRLDQRLALLTGGSRDLPTRQQTLRGAIDWSYHILDEPEQRLFERFSVFSGGAFLPEAEQVCGSAAELGIDVLDGLSALSDKSLVRAALTASEDPRFAMLATIREYAAEQLAGADGNAPDLRARHAQVYAAIVEACADKLTTAEGAAWQERLELDHDNLRAALDWAVASNDAGLAMRLVGGLWRFWQQRGHLHEARRRTDQVLAMAGVAEQPPLVRAKAFAGGGGICYWQGDFVAANRYYSAALAAARETGDDAEVALALYNLAFTPLDYEAGTQDARFKAGIGLSEEALALYQKLGDERGIANVHWALAIGTAALGDLAAAREHAQRALDSYRRLNDPFGIGWGAHMLTLYTVNDGNLDGASAYATEALNTFRRSGDVAGQILSTYDFAMIASRRGDRERELRLAGAVEALGKRAGVGVMSDAFEILDWRLPDKPTEGVPLRWWTEGAAMTLDEATDYALATPSEAPAT